VQNTKRAEKLLDWHLVQDERDEVDGRGVLHQGFRVLRERLERPQLADFLRYNQRLRSSVRNVSNNQGMNHRKLDQAPGT